MRPYGHINKHDPVKAAKRELALMKERGYPAWRIAEAEERLNELLR